MLNNVNNICENHTLLILLSVSFVILLRAGSFEYFSTAALILTFSFSEVLSHTQA